MAQKGRDNSKQKPADSNTDSSTGHEDAGGTGAFPVVAVGSSAGGLDALKELFSNMPRNTGMAFVVLTHQHPGHTSLLPELLSRETEIPVVPADDGVVLKPDTIYVGMPDGQWEIRDGRLKLIPGEPTRSLSIDPLFRSLAADQQERGICIVLSGTGSDGSLGLKAVKAEGGMAMVQQPGSAQYAGMPASAIATGLVDFVLAPADMPDQLKAYADGPYLTGRATAAQAPVIPSDPMQAIFSLLRGHTGHDFSGYKPNTLRRRIERRMTVRQLEDAQAYVEFLRAHPQEIDLLFKELLISVTSFFRDHEAWKALTEHLEDLITGLPDDAGLRAWVPGCATGEEAYSLAIALREAMERVGRDLPVQLFATDLDISAIDAARAGRYPDGIEADLPGEYLERYFVHEEGAYRISRSIREMVVFAPHNLIQDPPFTRLDIVSCRNLLIYLDADLQKRVLPFFHYALKPGGVLFLGPSESLNSSGEQFETLDKRWKIFRRREDHGSLGPLPRMPTAPNTAHANGPSLPVPGAGALDVRMSTLIERLLLRRFAPPSVVVNERGDIVYIHGRIGEYFEPAQGEPRNNVLDMAREGLRIELASAIRECAGHGHAVSRDDLWVKTNGEYSHVDLAVERIREPEAIEGLLLVTLKPAANRREPAAAVEQAGPDTCQDRTAQLERTLEHLKQSHEQTLRELEVSNEDLKSANEELQSTNEELQSSNEELETSKEEMHSLNEELTTVNSELQEKVEQLSTANDDLQNLLNNTDIATVFLDGDLNIKRYAGKITEIIMMRPTDIGRPISDLVTKLRTQDLPEDCREVLRTLQQHETEVQTQDGLWYLMRIKPYRTVENVIAGVVITFVDISRIKAGEAARDFFESIVDTVREPLAVLDSRMKIVSANRAFSRLFGVSGERIRGLALKMLDGEGEPLAGVEPLLKGILEHGRRIENHEIRLSPSGRGEQTFMLNAQRLEQDLGMPGRILLALASPQSQKT